jgi:hypothetical protein
VTQGQLDPRERRVILVDQVAWVRLEALVQLVLPALLVFLVQLDLLEHQDNQVVAGPQDL